MEDFNIYKSSLGLIKIEYNDKAVVAIRVVVTNDEKTLDMGKPSSISKLAIKQLNEYFDGKRKYFDIPIELKGTEFQKKVWKALIEIPYGETRSYKDIAISIGNPKAARAIGNANNKNPIAIVLPCHRVIGSNGKLVGYEYGVDINEKLLELEKSNNK